jgi:hypothetical protein
MNSSIRWVRSSALAIGAVAMCIATGACSKDAAPAPAPAVQAAPTPLKLGECAVMGASVSAGCECSLPGFRVAGLLEPHGHATFSSVLGAVTDGPSPMGEGDTMFFTNPDVIAQSQTDAAKAMNPKILFAVDFLFWHAYGDGVDAAGRLKRLEDGLARLDSFTCPIVIGDLPDMSHTFLISKSQFPGKEGLDKLNARLYEWASKHPKVVVVPLRDTVAKAIQSQSVSFGGRNFDGPAARTLLTPSGLHVTPDGLIALSHQSLNQLKEKGLIGNVVWDTDVNAITQRLIDAKKARDAEAKAKKAERAAKAAGKS